jgi:hypothetical protein
MTSSKLEATLAVKLLEKGSSSGYPMIIAKRFKGSFKCIGRDIKSEVVDDGKGGESTRFMVLVM